MLSITIACFHFPSRYK